MIHRSKRHYGPRIAFLWFAGGMGQCMGSPEFEFKLLAYLQNPFVLPRGRVLI